MALLTHNKIRQFKEVLLAVKDELSKEHYVDLCKSERRIKDLVAAIFMELADLEQQLKAGNVRAEREDPVEDSFSRAINLFVEAKKLKLEGDKETLKHFRD